MRLLLITREYPPYPKGGMCQIVEQMVKQHRRFGVEMTVIANHPGFGTRQEKIDGVQFYRVPSLGSAFLTQLPTFGFYASRLVKKIHHQFDVVYSNYSPLFGRIERPLVAGFHSTRYGETIGCRENGRPFYALLNRLYIPFDRGLMQKADGVIALCDKMVKEIIATNGRPGMLAIIPTGVDTRLFKPLSPRRFERPEKKIFYVGRLDARKGINVLIRAFKEVREKVNAKLVIVGEGSERLRLTKLAAALAVPVDFVGPVAHDRLPAVYNDADLLVSPSLYEGSAITLVILEAIACGTPTLISDALPECGIPRFVRANVGSLARMLEEFLASNHKLADLSERCLSLSRDYSWDNVVEQTFTYLRKFI
ncbi:MAG: glycosyltransferase family 4 protein [Desulfobacterales bacterium]|uniref:Glycosyltransferase family 4 protein n=1 Tax=Candidatus Desulfatibia vada TaxID=2841696 RepID=A0A8J6TPD5_9BACT|nr:glycosyltransferase family 4 protein [Candidatus Desulfatibia vada]